MNWDNVNIVLAKYSAEVKERTDTVLDGTKLKDRIIYNLNLAESTLFIKYPGYSTYVSGGRGKNKKMPPFKPINDWANEKGLVFRTKKGRFMTHKSRWFLIARKIARDGIKARPFLHFPKKLLPALVIALGPAVAKDIINNITTEIDS